MKTIIMKWITGLVCLFAFTVLLQANAYAAEAIDTSMDVSLTIQYEHEAKGIEGATFTIYKIAAVDAYGNYSLTDDFDSYPIKVNGIKQSGWEQLAETLVGYAQRDNISYIDYGETDQSGLVQFPSNGKSLKPGLYLVICEPLVSDGYIYTAKPSVVALPSTTANNTWEYNIVIQPKHERDTDFSISRKVLKIWDDAGYETARPAEVIVQLLKNDEVYDTVTLNQKNNWRYEWGNLDKRYNWSVAEKELPGYAVSIGLENGTFTVTNSFVVPVISDNLSVTKKLIGDTPSSKNTFTFVMKKNDESNPMPDGSQNGVKEVKISGAGSTEFGKITFTKTGVYKYTIYEENNGLDGYTYDTSIYTLFITVAERSGKLNIKRTLNKSDGTAPSSIVFTNSFKMSGTSNGGTKGNKMPQTGMLWWPVFVLFAIGSGLIMVGIILKRFSENES